MQLRFSLLIVVVIKFCVTVVATPVSAVDCKGWNSEDYFKAATVEDVAHCLRSGADPNALAEYGRVPLHYAARLNKNPALVAALLAAGADVNARTEHGASPLHYAAAHNENPALIIALLAAGADVNARTWDDTTPLHSAARNENPDIIVTFLAAGADVNARAKNKRTSLHVAARWSDNPAVLEALLNFNPDRNAQDKYGKTPLDYAKKNRELSGSTAYWRLNDAHWRLKDADWQ